MNYKEDLKKKFDLNKYKDQEHKENNESTKRKRIMRMVKRRELYLYYRFLL